MKNLIALLSLSVLMCGQAAAESEHALVTGMQTEHVDIAVDFTGQDTLIFGALSKRGDVIIKVSSPIVNMDLSKKRSIGPFWLDGHKLTVRNTPGLYYLLSSRPINKIVVAAEQKKYGLSLHNALRNAVVDDNVVAGIGDWQGALIHLKKKAGLFRKLPDAVKLQEHRLFVANIQLPAAIPMGTYDLDIYLVQHGHVIQHQTRHLDVSQVRLERWIAYEVNDHPWLFGILFTLFVMALGLTLGMAMRRSTSG